MRLTTLAPAKINVCLLLGPTRADGRHELVTVMQPVSLADTVMLVEGAVNADVVHCPGVEGDNLAATALAAFRARTGWDGTAVRVEIDKRIPVAAGMAGGSADAGAVLRLAAHAAGLSDDAVLMDIASGLGADVASQVRPGRVLATGAGERIERLPEVEPYGVLVLPAAEGLATAEVYRQADRLGLPRDEAALAAGLEEVRSALPDLPPELVVNELGHAALSLRLDVRGALATGVSTGADVVLVSGSGPTVLGLFEDPEDAERAAASIGGLAIAARTVGPEFAEVRAG